MMITYLQVPRWSSKYSPLCYQGLRLATCVCPSFWQGCFGMTVSRHPSTSRSHCHRFLQWETKLVTFDNSDVFFNVSAMKIFGPEKKTCTSTLYLLGGFMICIVSDGATAKPVDMETLTLFCWCQTVVNQFLQDVFNQKQFVQGGPLPIVDRWNNPYDCRIITASYPFYKAIYRAYNPIYNW